MASVLLDLANNQNFTIEDYDAYSMETYKDLKSMYHYLSKYDLNSLHELCMYNAKGELWSSHKDAFDVLDEKIPEFWKHKGKLLQ